MQDTLNYLKENLNNLETKNLNDIDLSKTQVFVVDLNNGFAKKGNLFSERINKLINPTVELLNDISDIVSNITAFTDCHDNSSVEFLSYPTHCLLDTDECEIVDELKNIKNLDIIKKNSTNAFFNLKDTEFKNVDNIIVIGDCTDICIYQFVITLKTYFNENNIKKEIIVPMDLVDTYHIDKIHDANLLNIVFLNSMIQNGIKVVKSIKKY